MSRIAFDIGGTNLRVAECRAEGIGPVERMDTPPRPEDAVRALAELARKVVAEAPTEIVGAVAGVIGEAGMVISSPHLPLWNGFALGDGLSRALGANVRVFNDADLAALGEAHFGAGKGYPIVAYLGLGTGVGGSRVVDGMLDPHAVGFEPGHQIVDESEHATLESLVGGAAIAATYGMQPEKLDRSAWSALTPHLAVGIWNLIVSWSPDVVVLGGALMNEENGFRLAEVTAAVSDLRQVLPTVPPILKGTLEYPALHGARAMIGLAE